MIYGIPTIALDADGVLVDINTPWLTELNRQTGKALRYEEITTWDWHLLFGISKSQLYKARQPEMYDEVQPIEGAQDGVRLLKQMGYRLVVLTHDLPHFARRKKAAIERLFPELTEIVFAKEKKAVMPTALLVDDAAHNRPDILLTQPWNARAVGVTRWVRADNWLQVVSSIWEMTTYGTN